MIRSFPHKDKHPAKLSALLLAAGKGTRLAPLTDTVPKCLVPINGRPLLSYWLDLCVNAGIAPVYINTHHFSEQVEAFVAETPWHDKIRLVHEQKLLGTGGTLLSCRKQLEHGTFLLAHADNLARFSMQEFVEAHAKRPKNCLLTMMLFRTPTPHTCGIVCTDDQGRVIEFHEKSSSPPSNMANAAVYLIEPEIFSILESCPSRTPDISLDLIPRCLGKIATFFNNDYLCDIGTPESYALAQKNFCSFNNT